MEGFHILNLGHVTVTTPTLGGQFVMLWLEHVVLDECTNYKVFIFNHSKNIKGVQISKWLT